MADEQALTIVKSEPLPELKIVKSEPEPGFISRLKDAAVDMPIGMVKGAARIGQSIPGVTHATDYMFGLPKGASAQSTEPTNLNQKIGTYLTDVAMIPAAGAVEAGGPILTKTAGYVSNPTVAEQGIAKLGDAARFTGDVASLVKANLSTGQLTAPKVAGLITKYGAQAVKGALVGMFGAGAYEAYKHLF